MGAINLDSWTFHTSDSCARRSDGRVATMTAKHAKRNTKAEPCGVCCSGRWSGATDDITGIEDENRGNLTKQELRLRIAKRVGLNTNTSTGFTKRELNAIHAYLTGEHYFEKRHYNTPNSASKEALRANIASPDAADITAVRAKSKFTHRELVSLCRAIESQDDERHQ